MEKFLIRGKTKQPAELNNPLSREKKEQKKQNSLQSALQDAYSESVKVVSLELNSIVTKSFLFSNNVGFLQGSHFGECSRFAANVS